MHTSEIIAAIEEEISRLEQVRNLLGGSSNGGATRGRLAAVPATAFPFGLGNATAAPKERHKMSAAGRARIAAAQKARWAKLKKANAKKASTSGV